MEQDLVMIEATIAAPRERVWQALTDPRELDGWLTLELDAPFKVGEMSTGTVYPIDEPMPWRSFTEVMEPPRQLVYRTPMVRIGEEITDDTSWLTTDTQLEPSGKDTYVRVIVTGLANAPIEERDTIVDDITGSWKYLLSELKAQVEE
ncbi:SRPBCC domain-containing protein [Paracoccus pacificus]|uniref:SRPBCC domain-containing protein n=1 Tax=Paracoccus pacificus TaxID=1463598 RepID=A0ABW4R2M9_9RHOB